MISIGSCCLCKQGDTMFCFVSYSLITNMTVKRSFCDGGNWGAQFFRALQVKSCRTSSLATAWLCLTLYIIYVPHTCSRGSGVQQQYQRFLDQVRMPGEPAGQEFCGAVCLDCCQCYWAFCQLSQHFDAAETAVSVLYLSLQDGKHALSVHQVSLCSIYAMKHQRGTMY